MNSKEIRNAQATITAAIPKSEEGSAWFWRIFGGTIIGGMVFLTVTLFNHINANINTVRIELGQYQKDNVVLRERITTLEYSLSTLKERIIQMESVCIKIPRIEQSRELDQERRVDFENSLRSLKEDFKELSKLIKQSSGG